MRAAWFLVVVAAAAGACGDRGASGPDAAPSLALAYTASLHVDPSTAADVTAFVVDGVTSTTDYTLTRTFVDLDAAQAASFEVEVTSAAGTQSFTLTPSACDGQCGVGSLDCSTVYAEDEQWLFYRGTLAYGSGAGPDLGPLRFTADKGGCQYAGGGVGWAD